MPLPLTVSCFSKIQIGFTFLVPAHLGSPGKGPLNGCVCVCDREREREIAITMVTHVGGIQKKLLSCCICCVQAQAVGIGG